MRNLRVTTACASFGAFFPFRSSLKEWLSAERAGAPRGALRSLARLLFSSLSFSVLPFLNFDQWEKSVASRTLLLARCALIESERVSQREKLAQLGWLSTSPGDKNPFGKNRILRQRGEKEQRIMPRCEQHARTHCDGKNAETEEIPAAKNTLSWSKTRWKRTRRRWQITRRCATTAGLRWRWKISKNYKTRFEVGYL